VIPIATGKLPVDGGRDSLLLRARRSSAEKEAYLRVPEPDSENATEIVIAADRDLEARGPRQGRSRIDGRGRISPFMRVRLEWGRKSPREELLGTRAQPAAIECWPLEC